MASFIRNVSAGATAVFTEKEGRIARCMGTIMSTVVASRPIIVAWTAIEFALTCVAIYPLMYLPHVTQQHRVLTRGVLGMIMMARFSVSIVGFIAALNRRTTACRFYFKALSFQFLTLICFLLVVANLSCYCEGKPQERAHSDFWQCSALQDFSRWKNGGIFVNFLPTPHFNPPNPVEQGEKTQSRSKNQSMKAPDPEAGLDELLLKRLKARSEHKRGGFERFKHTKDQEKLSKPQFQEVTEIFKIFDPEDTGLVPITKLENGLTVLGYDLLAKGVHMEEFVQIPLQPTDQLDIDEFTDWMAHRILHKEKAQLTLEPCPTTSKFHKGAQVTFTTEFFLPKRGTTIAKTISGTVEKEVGQKPRCHLYRIQENHKGKLIRHWVEASTVTAAKSRGTSSFFAMRAALMRSPRANDLGSDIENQTAFEESLAHLEGKRSLNRKMSLTVGDKSLSSSSGGTFVHEPTQNEGSGKKLLEPEELVNPRTTCKSCLEHAVGETHAACLQTPCQVVYPDCENQLRDTVLCKNRKAIQENYGSKCHSWPGVDSSFEWCFVRKSSPCHHVPEDPNENTNFRNHMDEPLVRSTVRCAFADTKQKSYRRMAEETCYGFRKLCYGHLIPAMVLNLYMVLVLYKFLLQSCCDDRSADRDEFQIDDEFAGFQDDVYFEDEEADGGQKAQQEKSKSNQKAKGKGQKKQESGRSSDDAPAPSKNVKTKTADKANDDDEDDFSDLDEAGSAEEKPKPGKKKQGK